MKLSEAIRLGAMLKPQAYTAVLVKGSSTCALGAAYDAVGLLGEGHYSIDCYGVILKAFPLLARDIVPCPACGLVPSGDEDDLADNISHLNDNHRWTRERIADWVATIEAAQEIGSPASINAVREETGSPVVCLRA